PTRAATAPVWLSKWPIWWRPSSPSPMMMTTTTTMMRTTRTTTKTMTSMTESGTAHSGGARPNSRGARRRAREFALQGIYGWLLRGDEGTAEIGEIDAHIRGLEGFAEADGQWYQTLLHGSVREASALRERFMRYVDRPLEELSPIEHAVLLIGSYELVYHIEVPYRAIINE